MFFFFFFYPFECACENYRTTDNILINTSVLEEQPIGQIILRLPEAISRHDEILTRSDSFKFHLIPTESWTYFRINEDGFLINIKRLDYEQLCASHLVTKGANKGNTPSCQMIVNVLIHENQSTTELKSVSKWKRRLRSMIIHVTLVDKNDNRPQCELIYPIDRSNQNYGRKVRSVNIPENIASGQMIANWVITDRDTANNGVNQVKLVGAMNMENSFRTSDLPFRLENDGVFSPTSRIEIRLTVSRPINYIRNPNKQHKHDQTDCYHLKLFALDSETPSNMYHQIPPNRNTNCQLDVCILDLNDHAPTWTSPSAIVRGENMVVELIEGKTYEERRLVQLVAIDGDRGPNALITYHFSQDLHNLTIPNLQSQVYENLQHFIQLNLRTGSLELRRTTIDFEELSRLYPTLVEYTSPKRLLFNLNLVAVDNPVDLNERRISPVASITIKIIDVNDNPPEITVIGLQPIEMTPQLQIVHIHSEIFLTVRENLLADEPVAFITVSDPETTNIDELSCSLTSGHNQTLDRPSQSSDHELFQLIRILPQLGLGLSQTQTLNYNLVTMKSFDREHKDRYHLNLTCTDVVTAHPSKFLTLPLSSHRSLHIIIGDVNDNPPRIVKVNDPQSQGLNPYECVVREHAPTGTKICQFKAIDLDQSEADGFKWWSGGDGGNLIDVRPRTGWLVVPNSQENQKGRYELDRETAETIFIQVFVQDGGLSDIHLTSNVTVAVHILDINDHAPQIVKYNHFEISEFAKSGEIIGQLIASDADSYGSPNSEIIYRMITIDSHMNDSLSKQFDEEFSSFLNSNGGFQFTPHAHLGDIQLEEKSGILRVASRGLDRERIASYKFVVRVSDGEAVNGQEALPVNERNHAHTLVHIIVIDENDNAPRIVFPDKSLATFTLTCSDLKRGLPHTIAKLSVNDSDAGVNGQVLYFLAPATHRVHQSDEYGGLERISSNSSEDNSNKTSEFPLDYTIISSKRNMEQQHNHLTLLPFQIDPQTGSLTIIQEPESDLCDREDRSPSNTGLEYRLKVIATDRGTPPLSSSVVLAIRITLGTTSNSPTVMDTETMHQSMRFNKYDPMISSQDISTHHLNQLTQLDANTRQYSQSTILNHLNTPDVFWAATICLIVATGVLIFLISLIIMVTCHRRSKSPTSVETDVCGTQQNEWAVFYSSKSPTQLSRDGASPSGTLKPDSPSTLNGSKNQEGALNSGQSTRIKSPTLTIKSSDCGCRSEYSSLIKIPPANSKHAYIVNNQHRFCPQRSNQLGPINGMYQQLHTNWRTELVLDKIREPSVKATVHNNSPLLMQTSFHSEEDLNHTWSLSKFDRICKEPRATNPSDFIGFSNFTTRMPDTSSNPTTKLRADSKPTQNEASFV